jgi:leucyl aminopeptidase
MKLDVKNIKLTEAQLPLLLIGLTEEAKEKGANLKLTGAMKKMAHCVIGLGDFKATQGEHSLLYSNGKIHSERIMLLGLGKRAEITPDKLRATLGSASRVIRDLGVEKLGVSLPNLTQGALSEEAVAEIVAEAFIMGSFSDPFHKTKDLDKFKAIKELHLITQKETKGIALAAEQGRIIAEAVNLCKQLAWGPPNHITPTRLTEEAKKLETLNVKTTVYDREQAKKIGLHSFLAVAKGTSEAPKFIVMEYGDPKHDTVAIIGKAITFDSGGLTLKPGEGMHLMKADMTGGAVVISSMKAIAQLKLPLHVVGVVPATDNMPDGGAYHPGDVINTYSGLTVEVISTDAEGRMILNDALSYAAKNFKPTAMFDFATLTGAMEVALGEHAMGYFANDDTVAERIEKASKSSGERVWRMPLWDVYDEQLKSDVADWKHTGGRPGGAITAARFLSKFVMDTPWAHFDIAGQDEQTSDKGYNPKGSKGPAVRLIVDMLRYWK